MEFEWSECQKDALKPADKNILVSAGAGSGKTQVLAQKVHDILKDGKASPESILVLTFTVAAAFSMKKRIKKNLRKNGVSEQIINKIDSAHISTFDSFTNYLVKKYASELNISECINVLNEQILKVKLNEFIEEILNVEYENKHPNFLKTLKTLCLKTDDDLKTVLMELYEKIDTFEDKDQILKNYESIYFDNSKIEKDYNDFVDINKRILKDGYDEIFNTSKNEVIDTNRLTAVKKYVDNLLNIDNLKFYYSLTDKKSNPFPPKARGGVEDKIFDKFKKSVKENIAKNLKFFSDYKASIERVSYCKDETLYLIELLEKLDNKIENYKKQTNSYTFNDIQRLALKLFKKDEVGKKIKDSFKFILVDEYQDTSDIQEKFINMIGENNIYMVGDIKQSIYKFRFANCDIFREKYTKYKNSQKSGIKVDMVDNFRSRKAIVDAVNEIFSSLMTDKRGGADYRNDHHILYGNKFYGSNVFNEDLYGIKLLTYNVEKNSEDAEIEMKAIANKIIELFKNKTKVLDSDDNVSRDIKFSDIAILLRSKTHFNEYMEFFANANIPLTCESNKEFKDYDSLLVIENILTGIEYFRANLNDDTVLKYVYTSIGRSFLFNYEDKQIYDSIKNKSYKTDIILKKCAGIAEFSKTNSVEKTFNMMLSEFNFINNLHRIDRPAQNLEKIEFLSGMSKNFDTSGLSFSEFASFFKKIDEYNIKFKIEDTVINKNAVQLMTHHKSKGLEWPIVFIAGISGNKEGVPDTTNGRFTKLSGIEFKCFEGNQVRSFYNRYNRIVNRFEDIGEEIRLFYVALTRARETLYMVCDKEVYEDYAVPCYNLTTFLNLLKNTKFEPKEETADITYNVYEGENLVVTIDKTNSKIVEFCSVFEEKITRRASHKIEETEISAELQSKLDMGNELHEYMETINFRTIDTSHIKNQKYKRFIDKVLNNSVFDDCKSDNFIDAYKEYEFIGDNLHGFVDLFLLYKDKIKIIDYKLKDISNPDYKKQLKTYKEYLSSVFKGKTISTYLISLIEGRCEEINTDEE